MARHDLDQRVERDRHYQDDEREHLAEQVAVPVEVVRSRERVRHPVRVEHRIRPDAEHDDEARRRVHVAPGPQDHQGDPRDRETEHGRPPADERIVQPRAADRGRDDERASGDDAVRDAEEHGRGRFEACPQEHAGEVRDGNRRDRAGHDREHQPPRPLEQVQPMRGAVADARHVLVELLADEVLVDVAHVVRVGGREPDERHDRRRELDAIGPIGVEHRRHEQHRDDNRREQHRVAAHEEQRPEREPAHDCVGMRALHRACMRKYKAAISSVA